MKQSRFLKDWRRRWVVLTPQYLCSYRSPETTTQPPTEALRLSDCNTVGWSRLREMHGYFAETGFLGSIEQLLQPVRLSLSSSCASFKHLISALFVMLFAKQNAAIGCEFCGCA